MKAQILKIAGCKNEKEFYKKFPNEEAFMKVHGKAFKKAQSGLNVSTMMAANNPEFMGSAFGNVPSSGFNINMPQQSDWDATSPKKGIGGKGNALGYAQSAMDIAQGISMIAGQKKKRKLAEARANASDVQLQAKLMQDPDFYTMNKQLNIRPEDRQDTGDEFFPIGGVGTDVLQAKDGKSVRSNKIRAGVSPLLKYPNASFEENKASMLFPYPTPNDIAMGNDKLASDSAQFVAGYRSPKAINEVWPDKLTINNPFEGGYYNQMFDQKRLDELPGKYNFRTGKVEYRKGGEIQNTYAPNNLYDDLGIIPIAQNGMSAMGDLSQKAQMMLVNGGEGEDAGSMIGGGLGNAVGSYFGGPVGGMIGDAAGSIIGGIVDRADNKIRKANNKTAMNQQAMNVANMNFSNGFMEDGGSITPPYPQAINGLEVYGGKAEPISANPYLPEGGQTVMFRGPSHDKGGMPIKYGDQGVEVEGGEPAIKLAEGSDVEPSLTVFGDLKPSKALLAEVGLEELHGKKFKNMVADLSKKTDKLNKLKDKSVENLNEQPIRTSLDKLTFNSWKANIMGIDPQLKEIADQTKRAGELQNAINTTADENGLSASDLARGVVKKDKSKKAIAQNGWFGEPLSISPESQKEFDKQYSSDENGNTRKGTRVDDQQVRSLIFKYFSDEKGFTPADRQKAYDIMMAESSGEYDAVGINDNSKVTNPNGQYWGSKDVGLFQINNVAHPEYHKSGDLTDADYNVRSAAEIAMKAKRAGKDPFSPWVSHDPSKINPPMPVTRQSSPSPSPSNFVVIEDEQDPPLVLEDWMKNPSTFGPPAVIPSSNGEIPKKDKFSLIDAINAAIPYLRPNYQLRNPDLTAEYMAMGYNQLEPVQARKYNPQLDVPYDISYQDLLNKNQGDYRAISRMAQNNPALLAQLNAQKYAANQQVLGDQFRVNQAMKDKVYSKNRDILNDAQLKNLGIMDQQYVRQATAKSKTQEEAIRIANSISDKLNKHELEQDISNIEGQRYNYRFDNNGRPINMNPLARWDMSGSSVKGASEAEKIALYEDYIADYKDKQREARKAARETSVKNGKTLSLRNGAIVQSLKTI